jgi:hypothetical protein
MYSSPPVHGILLVSGILSDPSMKALWVEEVKVNTNTSYFILYCFIISQLDIQIGI